MEACSSIRIILQLNQKILLEQLLSHQLENVREWAEKMIDYTERCIKREELDDEERYL